MTGRRPGGIWGEVAGLQLVVQIYVPERGLPLPRAVLASGAGGELCTDSLKTKPARTVPLIADVVPIIDR